MAEILTRFEKAFEKGFKGEVESFKVWLEKQGASLAKLRYETITDELIAKQLFINRIEELETIAEFLGFHVREKKEVFHIPVIGATGIGKTALLHAIEFALSKLDTHLKFKYYDASTFSEQDEEEEPQLFFRYLEEVKSEKYDVLLIDACEKDRNIDYSLREFFRAVKRFVLITSWEPQFWYVLKDKVEEVIPTAKQLFLKPFSREETKQLLEKVLLVASEGKTELPEEVLMKISELSEGVPRVAILLLVRSFYEAFISEKNSVDTESVLKAASSLGILSINERLEKLTDVHETILRLILQSTDPRGIRPTELVEKLNKDKATVSYHLNYLLSENVLSVRRLGRYAFYQVREELKPFIQLKIIQEGDFLA
jgi:DNA-binding transcriptional ArsR family regulator